MKSVVKKAIGHVSARRALAVTAALAAATAIVFAESVLPGGAVAFAAEEGGGLQHASSWDWGRDGARLINFGVVFAALLYLALRFGKPFVEHRKEELLKTIEDLDRARKEAERKLAELETKTKNLQSEVESIRNNAARDAESVRAQIVENAHKEAERILARAKEQVEQEFNKARQQLQAEAAAATVSAAEELLRRNVRQQDHDAIVKDYFAKLEQKY